MTEKLEGSKVARAENRSKEHRWRVYCDCGFVSNGYASYNDCEDKRVTHLRSHSVDATRPTGDGK